MASHISLVALARVRDIVLPDPNKPKSYVVYCDFKLEKEKDLLTIPVSRFFLKVDDIPVTGSYVWLSGPFWMPPENNDLIEAESFESLAIDPLLELTLPAPSVTALGTVATVIGRNIYMDVSAYNRQVRAVVSKHTCYLTPLVQVKDDLDISDSSDGANMQMPKSGTKVAISGILADISIHESVDDALVPSIELESITYLPREKPRTDYSKKSQPSQGGKTKRQLVAEKAGKAVDTGRPLKKSKSGPIDAFTAEELGSASSSQPSSSQGTASQGSPSEASSSHSCASGNGVSESSPDSPPSSVENTPLTTGWVTRGAAVTGKGAKGKGSGA